MKAFKIEKIVLNDDECELLDETFDLLRKFSDVLEQNGFSSNEDSLLYNCNEAFTHLGNFLDKCNAE